MNTNSSLLLSGARSFSFDWRNEQTYQGYADFGDSGKYFNDVAGLETKVNTYGRGPYDHPIRKFILADLFDDWEYATPLFRRPTSKLSMNYFDRFYQWQIKGQIENLKISYFLGNSLPYTPLPDIEMYDSTLQRQQKQAEAAKENYMNLEVYLVNGYWETVSGTPVFGLQTEFLTKVKIQNNGLIVQQDLLKNVSGSGVKLLGLHQGLAFVLANAGFGLIKSSPDFVSLSCDVAYHITGELNFDFQSTARNIMAETPDTQWIQVIEENQFRNKLILTNTGTRPLTIRFAPAVATTHLLEGVVLVPGGSWNDEGLYTQKEAIYARSHEGLGVLSGLETTAVI